MSLSSTVSEILSFISHNLKRSHDCEYLAPPIEVDPVGILPIFLVSENQNRRIIIQCKKFSYRRGTARPLQFR